MIISTCSILGLLATCFTTANIPENQVYNILPASLPIKIIIRTLYISTDHRYCDHELRDPSNSMKFRFVCPIQRYKNIHIERIKTYNFTCHIGQAIIYSLRFISI